MLPSTDPLDQSDFDPVTYINSIFPNEQSLANVDDVMLMLRNRIGLEDLNDVISCPDSCESLKCIQIFRACAEQLRFGSFRGLDDEIRSVVRRQTAPNADGRASLKEAQTALHHLFASVKDIKVLSLRNLSNFAVLHSGRALSTETNGNWNGSGFSE